MNKVSSVHFRMYDTGSVGDCFLLLFMQGPAITFKMMIDCGGWQTNAAAVSRCVNDISQTCAGEIDLLIMTHQHEDHVSGFNLARPIFDQLSVKQVWMSWMENPADSIAKVVKEKYGKQLKAATREIAALQEKLKPFNRISYAVTSANRRFAAKTRSAKDAMDLLALETGIHPGRSAASGAHTNQHAVDYIKKIAGKPKYWKPGDVVKDLKGAEGMTFYMLGPPRDADMKLFFTRTEVTSEIYQLAAKKSSAANEAEEDETEYTTGLSNSGIALQAGCSPFASRFQLKGAELKSWHEKYNNEDHNWRQIETDSQEGALGIALDANKYTNNTSFAMAIEFEDSGRVILLPGDAQSGNWMGWHKPDVMQSLKQKGGKDTNELLASTVFYKIGHHCSKNGTASFSGLDNMNSPDLVGFIPLIKAKVPTGWHPEGFPAPPLYSELIKKTNGRLVRTDEGIVKDPQAKKLRAALTVKERQKFENNYRKGNCYHEYVISGK